MAEEAPVKPLPVTEEELDTCTHVISVLAKDLEAYEDPRVRKLRKAMNPIVSAAIAQRYGGTSPAEHNREVNRKRSRGHIRRQQAVQDRLHINKCKLRASRLKKMKDLMGDMADGQASRLLIPDGVAEDEAAPGQRLLEDGAGGELAEGAAGQGGAPAAEAELMTQLRSCYACKARFGELHDFYDQLCPSCASLNYKKRYQRADMSGKVVLLTGGRVKIGYQVGLKLLRSGASLIVTTRFPHDAASRYAGEADSAEWIDRLHVYGMDLRDLPRLESFCRSLYRCYPHLDAIINNACQTIRRPPAYYAHLLDKEMQPVEALPAPVQRVLQGPVRHNYPAVLGAAGPAMKQAVEAGKANVAVAEPTVLEVAPASGGEASTALQQSKPASSAADRSRTTLPPTALGSDVPSALKSQVAVVRGDEERDEALFPPAALDVNAQQIDLRRHNSWLLKLEEVETGEAAEVMAVNSLAPFILNSRLKGLMARAGEATDKFIVNVSAMEGKFYRYKLPTHPHTNMAKAALNMMTRTSAGDYRKSRIFMNSVDTGWINDENPLEKARKIADSNNFQTPIDEVDAAARILDPVFSAVNGETPVWGKFLKDYAETEW